MSHDLLLIEKLVVGGMGLARRADGLVVLIPYVIPGEKVSVDLGPKKKSFQHGQVKEVVEPSPDRLSPPCPYFGRCGGCHFQHIAISRQDALKKDIFYDEFQRSGLNFGKHSIRYLSSALSFGYRQRIRLHVEEGRMGFFQHHSHSLLEIDHCLLARPEINTLLDELSRHSSWLKVAEHVGEVEIHVNPGDGRCLLITSFNRKPRPRDLSSLREVVADLPDLASLLVKSPDGALVTSFPDTKGRISYRLAGKVGKDIEVALEPGGFCQVNEGQNQQMVNQLLDWLEGEPQGRVLDLFCGVGNFSLPMAGAGFTVTGIDQQRSAIRSALDNAERNHLACDFQQGAALEGLKKIARAGETFNYVLLDPPRAGFKEGSALLPALKAEKIIYISCDQATLFRDLKAICVGGYEVAAITLVDQFCQSYHLESMVLLNRL